MFVCLLLISLITYNLYPSAWAAPSYTPPTMVVSMVMLWTWQIYNLLSWCEINSRRFQFFVSVIRNGNDNGNSKSKSSKSLLVCASCHLSVHNLSAGVSPNIWLSAGLQVGGTRLTSEVATSGKKNIKYWILNIKY